MALFGFNSRRLLTSDCFTCLYNSTHRKLRCIGNVKVRTNWLMIYVPTEVMPASVFAALHNRAPGQSQGHSQEFDLGVYVLTSHCNFKTYVNVPHVNKTVTDFGVYIPIYRPPSLRPWTELHFRHRVPYSLGWIASQPTRDCLSWHWISWRLLPLSLR